MAVGDALAGALGLLHQRHLSAIVEKRHRVRGRKHMTTRRKLLGAFGAVALMAMGATDVVPEATEGSLQLAAHVLAGIGLSDDAVSDAVDDVRRALLHDIGPEQT